MIRIVIADDHAVVRAGVRAVLGSEPDIEIVGEAGDAEALLRAVAGTPCDVVLLDLTMPGGRGVDLIARLRRDWPNTRTLVLSMHSSPEHVSGAMNAGARGYVVKGSGLDDLVLAVRVVARGELFLDSVAAQHAARAAGRPALTSDIDRLTLREREVLRHVALGKSNREIAQLLDISPKTVDTHRTSLMRKLDLHDAASLTRFAVRQGMIVDE